MATETVWDLSDGERFALRLMDRGYGRAMAAMTDRRGVCLADVTEAERSTILGLDSKGYVEITGGFALLTNKGDAAIDALAGRAP